MSRIERVSHAQLELLKGNRDSVRKLRLGDALELMGDLMLKGDLLCIFIFKPEEEAESAVFYEKTDVQKLEKMLETIGDQVTSIWAIDRHMRGELESIARKA